MAEYSCLASALTQNVQELKQQLYFFSRIYNKPNLSAKILTGLS